MFAEISCEKLEKIASRDFFDKPTIEDIYDCFVYREKVTIKYYFIFFQYFISVNIYVFIYII